jgi:hypothetical protein
MAKGINKLAGDLQGVLRASAEHLVKLANSNAELLATTQSQEHELKAYKLARRMEQRGLSPDLDFEQKVAKLLETPVEKLATFEQAVELASSEFRLGSVELDEKVAEGGSPTDELSSYIMSQQAYT